MLPNKIEEESMKAKTQRAYEEYALVYNRERDYNFIENNKELARYLTVEQNVARLRACVEKGYDVMNYRLTVDKPTYNVALKIVQREIAKDAYYPIYFLED